MRRSVDGLKTWSIFGNIEDSGEDLQLFTFDTSPLKQFSTSHLEPRLAGMSLVVPFKNIRPTFSIFGCLVWFGCSLVARIFEIHTFFSKNL